MRLKWGPDQLSIRAARALLAGSTMVMLAGCVSATGELQAVSTQAQIDQAKRPVQAADPNAAQVASTEAIPQTAQVAQAQPDQLYPVAIDPSVAANQQPDAMPGAIAPKGSISATTNSIYATQPQTLGAQAAALEAQNPGVMAANAAEQPENQTGLPVMVPLPTVNPVKTSLFQAPVVAETPQTEQAPVVAAQTPVEQPVPVTQEPIVTAMIDPSIENGNEAFPGQFAAQIPLTKAHEEAEDGQPGDDTGKTRSLGMLDNPDSEPMPSMQTLTTKAPKKKKFTLGDLFRRKQNSDDQFAKPARRTVDVAAMPALNGTMTDNGLPGVQTAAMFANPGLGEDQSEETPDDEPAGLMKLASLPSLTRQPMNGLWQQTDEVEVRCLRPQLVQMLKYVEAHYQRPVVVTSGYRNYKHNRRVGGVRGSLHTLCAAADIQVEGVTKWQLAEYLRTIPGRGGVGTYCHTDSVHIDVGSERDWNWRCRRKKKRHS